ncbi:hypothetical protein CHARACLAT_010050, partial [Characodon lateralis]|nr:hypothetical protein [Characodon lateralis]
AWETTIGSTKEPVMLSKTAHVAVTEQELGNLPGSVPELKEERPSPKFHNLQFQQYGNTLPGVSEKRVTA